MTPQEAQTRAERAKPGESLTRELNGQIRALEGEGNERKVELSFSSEEPYTRWFGPEILDHSPGAVDLTRLNEIGVVLFNHDRYSVIGRIERAWIEGDRGKAIIVFDDDEAADVIFRKVQSGTLKGVSVGYRVNNWEVVEAGSTSANGKYAGPCEVAINWEPYEISIVSVPADPTVGVGRELEAHTETQKQAPSMAERQLQINLNNLF
jgi:HK97 family phage prohead protease